MFCRPLNVVTSIVLMCSVSACTTTKLSSEQVPGKELSRIILDKKVIDSKYVLTEIDMYNVSASANTCTADYVKSENKVMTRNFYEYKNCASLYPVFMVPVYAAVSVLSLGTFLLTDSAQGFKRFKELFACSVTDGYQLEAGEGTMTREFLDKKTRTCSSAPVTTGTVEVAYGEQTLNRKPSDQGLVRLPMRHIGHLENLDKKTTIVWQYEGTRMTTTSNFTPAQRQETVKNYLNKLADDKLFTMQLNDRSGFYHPDNKLMDEIKKELPKYYRLEKIANQAPEAKSANRLARSENQVARAADDRAPNRLSKSENAVAHSSAEDRSMNRLAKSENMVASADEQSAYRLVPTRPSVYFKSGDYTGNIELPVIDYSETPKPVEVKTNIMSRKVNSLLPAYQNEDRNMKVEIKDTSMSLTNKTGKAMQLNKMSLYYNGKFVDNILEHPMELAPGATTRDIPLAAVIDRELGLLAKYGSLNANQAQRMKINFGLGASYLDPQTNAPSMMNKVNSYSVYDMVKNISETERLDGHMLSLLDEKSIPSSELREMITGSAKAAEGYDPTEVQQDLKVEFDTGKFAIKKEYLVQLEKIGSTMKKYPKSKGIIEGHSDNVGTEEVNQKLSERRAAAVKQYLVQTFGIDPRRIQAEGFGMARPVADNDSAAGRAQNRRIEGRIMELGA
jgi:outer membrane protein OmpA-like peptidoglycan-associated protein